MKKFLKSLVLLMLVCVVFFALTGCGKQEENQNIIEHEPEIENQTTEEVEIESKELTNGEMYDALISNYENALKEYDLEDLDSEERIMEKYDISDTTLLMHIARYSGDGVKLTYSFYDIDKNGIDELLLEADEAIGAIYTYDQDINEPVSVFFQSTLERGNLSVYDNGIILSEGSGGAALHYFEFGKIDSDGVSYELLEAIEEEYIEGSETPVYRDAETGEELEYKSLDEIMNEYISGANKI